MTTNLFDLEKNDRIRLGLSSPKLLHLLNLILKALKLLTLNLIETFQPKSVRRLKYTNWSLDLHVASFVGLIWHITCKSIESILNWLFVWPWHNYSNFVSLIALLIKVLYWGHLLCYAVLATMLLYFWPCNLSTTIMFNYFFLIVYITSRFLNCFFRRFLSLVYWQTNIDIHWAWFNLKALGVTAGKTLEGLGCYNIISHCIHSLEQ